MRLVWTLVACVVAWQVGASTAAACRCFGPDPGPRALRAADAALLGRVAEVERYPSGSPRRFRLRVEETFAGPVAAETWIHMRDTSCAIRWLADDEEWIVFASRDDEGRLWTRQCTGTVRTRPATASDGAVAPRSRRFERILRALRRAAGVSR